MAAGHEVMWPCFFRDKAERGTLVQHCMDRDMSRRAILLGRFLLLDQLQQIPDWVQELRAVAIVSGMCSMIWITCFDLLKSE